MVTLHRNLSKSRHVDQFVCCKSAMMELLQHCLAQKGSLLNTKKKNKRVGVDFCCIVANGLHLPLPLRGKLWKVSRNFERNKAFQEWSLGF